MNLNPYWKQYGGPGYKLVEQAEATIARYGMLAAGDVVVVGVSGGPDSVCLLDVLSRIGERFDLTLLVAHVDHGLSEEAANVAAKVSKSAAEEGYDVHLARAPDLSGSNLHARARDFRYEFFQIVVEKEGAQRVATAHTLDDRVETVLARLIHGAGTEGLAGIPPIQGNRIRPLMDIRRAESRAYCVERGLEFYDDPANEDDRFERPAIRSTVLAPIESHWGDGAVRAIARSAERLREDSDALGVLAGRLYPGIADETSEALRIQRDQLDPLPRALRRRVLEQAVGRVRDRSAGIDAVLDALDSPFEKGKERRFSIASGIEILLGDKEVLVSKLRSTEAIDPATTSNEETR